MSPTLNNLLPLAEDFDKSPKLWASQLIAAMEDILLFREIATGSIMYWGNNNPPPQGWRECDGTVVLQDSFPELYFVINDVWDTGGEAANEFRLPSLTGSNFAQGFWMIKL